MGKYGKKKKQMPEAPDHVRFCRVCGRKSYSWVCCGQRTSRVNSERFARNQTTQTLGDKAKLAAGEAR